MTLRFFIASLFFFSLSINAKEIAITFDDAPKFGTSIMSGQERTDKIIQGLKAENVEDALFFVTTSNITKENNGIERLKQYTNAGFHLANHSHSHQSANKTPLNEYIADIALAKNILKQFDNLLPYLRFPYLHYGKDQKAIEALQAGIAQLGYQNGYVTIDNFDWYINGLLVDAKSQDKTIDWQQAEKLYVDILWKAIKFYDDIAQQTLGRSPKHVLLLHENDAAALFLPALIRHIRQQGWKIISPQEAYQDPIAKIFPKTDYHKQGRVAAIAHSKGWLKEQLKHQYENAKALDDLMIKYRVVK